jgi:hypothetical protein
VGISNQKEDILSRLSALEKQVKEMRRGTLSNAVISSGNLEVRTSDGHTIMRVGELAFNGEIVSGIATYRRDGSMQRIEWDNEVGGGSWAMFDDSGNIIAAEDSVSGQGLATPWIGMHATPMTAVATPTQSTTSATFAALWRTHGVCQHPRIRVRVVTKLDVGTTGEIRLAIGGVPVGTMVELPSGDNTYRLLEGPVAGAHLSDITVDVEARRVAGAGTVRIEVVSVVGRQS